MDITTNNSYELKDLSKINIILGKNGVGKSNLLRDIDNPQTLSHNPKIGNVKYITPERGGVLVYQSGIEDNMEKDKSWLPITRRTNQTPLFKPQTVILYRLFETRVLREIANERRDDKEYTFDTYIEKINSLLDHVKIRPKDTTFKIYKKDTNDEIPSKSISSGESELISLAIECFVFQKESDSEKVNVLCLDEPDVHLHPDLQVRLINLLEEIVKETESIRIIIATHSTAILGALSENSEARIAFKEFGEDHLVFRKITEKYKKLIPIFGAHPLSNIFNQSPILLVEGEDDVRIWQQVIRSSEGRIRIYPCSTDTTNQMNKYEVLVQDIIGAIYDDAKAYSLRDKDDILGKIKDLDRVKRFRLVCRNAESLLLTDEVLRSLDTTWTDLQQAMRGWIDKNAGHSHFEIFKNFRDNGFDRENFDIKVLRNDLMGIMGQDKPWEVAVGQVIGELHWDDTTDFEKEGSILKYLGADFVKEIIPKAH